LRVACSFPFFFFLALIAHFVACYLSNRLIESASFVCYHGNFGLKGKFCDKTSRLGSNKSYSRRKSRSMCMEVTKLQFQNTYKHICKSFQLHFTSKAGFPLENCRIKEALHGKLTFHVLQAF